jgi:hypothetical protein
MKEPTQCVLWKKPELVGEPMKERFELLDTYEKESHLWRYLLKCRECGQRYFFQFEEEIDWTGGNDPQYSVYIPIETDREITMLKKASPSDLYSFTPRIQSRFPSDAKEPTIGWVGKDDIHS